jgi:hypothetical protein
MFILFSADDENDEIVKELVFPEMPSIDLLELPERDIDTKAVLEKARLGKGWHDGDHTLYHLVEIS